MKLGLFQCGSDAASLAERLDRLHAAVTHERQTTGEGPAMVVCPELFASGYHIGDRLRERALAQNSPGFERIRESCRALDLTLVFGYPECEGTVLYNSAACIDRNGNLLANHRKRLNAPGSFEVEYFTEGAAPTLFTVSGMRCAILICYEVEFPEMVREVAMAGAQLVLVPTALASRWDVVASRVVPARAFENGVWVAYVNHAGTENGLEYLGGSTLAAPNGEVAVRADPLPALVCGTVDASHVGAAQRRLPYLRDVQRAGLARLPG